jgi:N-acetylmuramic acid 6-phosphate (MurNAc-6-P) etherase
LAAAEGSVKVGVLLLYGCRAEEAKALLERSGGHLRVALAELRKSRASPE